jgi:CheY-like chemotaxis protein
MVVEDDTIILLDIEHTLRQLGLSDIHTATTLAKGEALSMLPDIRFAILDFELGRLVTSLPLAETLAARGIHMIFLTAYGADLQLPSSLANVPVLPKPFTTDMLAAKLMEVVGAGMAEARNCACG